MPAALEENKPNKDFNNKNKKIPGQQKCKTPKIKVSEAFQETKQNAWLRMNWMWWGKLLQLRTTGMENTFVTWLRIRADWYYTGGTENTGDLNEHK